MLKIQWTTTKVSLLAVVEPPVFPRGGEGVVVGGFRIIKGTNDEGSRPKPLLAMGDVGSFEWFSDRGLLVHDFEPRGFHSSCLFTSQLVPTAEPWEGGGEQSGEPGAAFGSATAPEWL